jgi:hypothetical protein
MISNERDGYGDITFEDPVLHKCYRYGKVQQVVSLKGEQTTSSLQLLVDGILPIKADDQFIFGGHIYPVKAFAHFDGLQEGTGTTVVYL